MTKVAPLLAALLALGSANALGEQYRVVGVMDGDTIRAISPSHHQIKCRLHGIDAPEKSQPFGERSKQSLSDMVFNKTVDVEVVDQDHYGRSVCRISLNGLEINKAQIQRGMAWHYKKFSNDPAYGRAEDVAREQRIGLWADHNPTPPWAFRRSAKTASSHY